MKVTDPDCDSALEMDERLARAEHRGWVYFFCSKECCRRFLETPDRYAVALPLAGDG